MLHILIRPVHTFGVSCYKLCKIVTVVEAAKARCWEERTFANLPRGMGDGLCLSSHSQLYEWLPPPHIKGGFKILAFISWISLIVLATWSKQFADWDYTGYSRFLAFPSKKMTRNVCGYYLGRKFSENILLLRKLTFSVQDNQRREKWIFNAGKLECLIFVLSVPSLRLHNKNKSNATVFMYIPTLLPTFQRIAFVSLCRIVI